jgi:excisionase family DNA binding protein
MLHIREGSTGRETLSTTAKRRRFLHRFGSALPNPKPATKNLMPNKSKHPAAKTQPAALKLKEAAQFLNVSVPTVHRLRRRGLLRANRMTRHCLFPISELQRALEAGLE